MKLSCIAIGVLCAAPTLALAQQRGLVQGIGGESLSGHGHHGEGGGDAYMVQPRDTFTILSERLGVTESELAGANDGARVALVGRFVDLPERLISPAGPDFGELLARVQQGVTYADRGLNRRPRNLSDALARRPDGRTLLPGESGTPFAEHLDWEAFPERGVMPKGFAPWTLDFLHPEVTQACVAVGREGPDGAQVRWHGRAQLENVAWGGAAHTIPAFLTVSALNRYEPGESLPRLSIRGLGEGRDRTIRVPEFLTALAAERDGARAESLARFVPRAAREAWSVAQTGHAHELQGDFGVPSFAPPGLFAGYRTVLEGRADQGEAGENRLSAYDLTRLLAMGAWHPYLNRDQRLGATRGDGLRLVLESFAHDRARYLDLALGELGLRDQLAHPAIVSASGWDRLPDGGYRLTYAVAFQADDRRRETPVQRRFVLALAVEHPTPEWAEARLAHQVLELTRWLFSGELR